MKKIRTILCGLVAAFALMFSTSVAKAQDISPEMLRMVVAEMNKELPMQVEEGMNFTKVALNSDCTVLTLYFDLNPKQMGMTLEEAKAELGSYSGNDMKAMVGDDIEQLFALFNCTVDLVINYPDKTSQTFHLTK